jgi:hypothetical protein
MSRSLHVLVTLGIATVGALAFEADARACGGCFAPEAEGSVVTDHRMVLSISPQQTTLYDQIRYRGNPSSFAWVLPISGSAKIGLSADIVFAALERQTATELIAPPLQRQCPQQPVCPSRNHGSDAGTSSDGAAYGNGSDPASPPVDVTKQETVGPYETVQLHSTDGTALTTWLVDHGYAVPEDVKPIISAYVDAKYDFLALKLVPGQGVQAMRPVRVTTAGASPVLPLRMVTAGTGATVGLTLWVVGEGRYEPQNFPFFKVETADLVWDWNAYSSNYKSLRADAASKLGGRGWEMESSIPIVPSLLRSLLLNAMTGGGSFDYQAIPANDGGTGKTASQVRDEDLDTLFAGMPAQGSARITRLRADVAHAALADDLVLTASTDQSELSNFRNVPKGINEPACPAITACPPGDGDDSFDPSGGGGESFSCNTARQTPGDGDTPGFGVLETLALGFVATALLRRDRKRRRHR